ncbi:MAG: type II toxin-antitoxin system RelE/ParE family toxin [Candidatus Binatia bacterium]
MAGSGHTAVWSPEAIDDRERLWDHYVGVAGTRTAEKIFLKLADVILLIEDRPFAGRARNEIRPGLRSFAATPHIIFYRVVNDTPEIVRVLAGRQDIEEQFAEGGGD